jgi:molybdenum cofactor guanylyltransferase
LAGGQSTRMGEDKALLRLNGVPLLRRLIDQSSPLSDVYVLTPWPERYEGVVPTSCHLIQEQPAAPGLGEGPLMAFAQGLKAISTSWILLLACDLPNLTTATLETWTQELPRVPPDAIALLPKHSKGWEPLCGFYRRRCQSHLEAYIATGGRSFQGWLTQDVVQELTVCDQTVLFNCNTPVDWQRLANSRCLQNPFGGSTTQIDGNINGFS